MNAFCRIILAALTLLTLSAAPDATQPVAPSSSFRTIDIFIDANHSSLAAYQFEFWSDEKDVKLVGIEGGEHAAFSEPPYYDPKALSAEKPRVIVAAFSTGENLPTGKTRVARLMVHVGANKTPNYQSTLQAAANADAKAIAEAKLSISEGVER